MFCRFLFALLLMATPAWATILHVPAEYPQLQSALDDSSPEDTVQVARGTYFGRFTSPLHSLTLCSDYLFTGDSTDINETILDGEFLGTILDVLCLDQSFTLCGFTLQHGMGQHLGNVVNCHRAGAVQASTCIDLEIRDVVFRENRAPHDVPVLFFSETCTTWIYGGNLTLRNISCVDNTIDDRRDGIAAILDINATQSTLIMDGLFIDAGTSTADPISMSASSMDSVYVNNIRVLNGAGGSASFHSSTRQVGGQVFSNIRFFTTEGNPGTFLGIQVNNFVMDSSTAVLRNIELEGIVLPDGFYLNTQGSTIDLDGLRIKDCRNTDNGGFATLMAGVPGTLRNVELSGCTLWGTYDTFCYVRGFDFDGVSVHDCRASADYGILRTYSTIGNTMRNLRVYNNVTGIHGSNVARKLIDMYGYNLDGAYIHNNRAIIPYIPIYGGNHVAGATISVYGDVLQVSNIRCENNRVDDYDPHGGGSSGINSNTGRDFLASATTSLTARNIVVLHSRQHNHCPEVYSNSEVWPHELGSSLVLGGGLHVDVDSVWMEDIDDGGLSVYGDSIRVTNAVFRSVERSAIQVGYSPTHVIHRDFHFSNILAQDIVATDNLLPANQRHLSRQSFIQVEPLYDTFEWATRLRIENSTVTGCRDLRHLIHGVTAMQLDVVNSVFWDNTAVVHSECEGALTQDWQFNVLPSNYPVGENYYNMDPLFDPEQGVPVLREDSVCIDGGSTDTAYNDAEDPSHPGMALWPGQGTVRNDIGYTGGPYAGDLDYVLPVVRRPSLPESRPRDFALHPARPNPFNPTTTLSYTLAVPGRVELSVYNLQGQRVRTLVSGWQPAGLHEIVLEAGVWASGVYMVELHSNGSRQTTKLLLLK